VRRILVVDGDPAVAETLRAGLAASGYGVGHARTGAEARALLKRERPDLILLDLLLPDIDGLVLLPGLKALAPVPLIACSASGQRRDRVLSLKLGADDFVAKPLDVDELEARLEAALRRATAAPSPGPREPLQLGGLLIDPARLRVTLGGQPILLTPTEYRLLLALASRPGQVLSREQLARLVWDQQRAPSGAINVHVCHLRIKLSGAPVPPPAIVAVRGFGYMLEVQGSQAPPPPPSDQRPRA
jgi:DNA-binding response OmpR family regulator